MSHRTPPVWHPSSWRERAAAQEVVYPDEAALAAATAQLQTLPPLVSCDEVDRLTDLLADCAVGRAFLLQGGDCAEAFEYCEENAIRNKLAILLQMSLILVYSLRRPIIRVGRLAGQYAKPRSSQTETLPDGTVIPSFRGDIVNALPATAADRRPDPRRMVEAYFRSAATLNYMRTVLASGFASLHHPDNWMLGHIKHDSLRAQYEGIVAKVLDALAFTQSIGASAGNSASITTATVFTSHEALHLHYEEALTRSVATTHGRVFREPYTPTAGSPLSSAGRGGGGGGGAAAAAAAAATAAAGSAAALGGAADGAGDEPLVAPATRRLSGGGGLDGDGGRRWYASSAHFVWIGDRTRQVDCAHVEYCRGIRNPIGVKVGPTTDPGRLVELLHLLNPERRAGKVTLITRLGVSLVRERLPTIIRPVLAAGWGGLVVWSCDPMHGNTHTVFVSPRTDSGATSAKELSPHYGAAVSGLPSPPAAAAAAASGGAALKAESTAVESTGATAAGVPVKTRSFVDIVGELKATMEVHAHEGSVFGGVHLELTGDFGITECTGGGQELDVADLSGNYATFCDPRLNAEQSLDVAFEVAAAFTSSRSLSSSGFPLR